MDPRIGAFLQAAGLYLGTMALGMLSAWLLVKYGM
jgi:hypothetical protein